MSKKTTDETLGREAVKEYLQQYHTAVGKKRILDKILENKRNRKLLEEYMARKQQRAGPHGRNNRP